MEESHPPNKYSLLLMKSVFLSPFIIFTLMFFLRFKLVSPLYGQETLFKPGGSRRKPATLKPGRLKKKFPLTPVWKFREKPEIKYEDFVGSKACEECHIEEYSLWQESTHRKAGAPPDSGNVISEFDGTVLKFKDATVRLSINTQKEYMVTVEQDGKPNQVFKVEAVVGGGHMVGGGTQALFTKFPDGSMRFLPFDYGRHDKVWFVELRKTGKWRLITEQISINECGNWPPVRVLGEHENFDPGSCGSCHGSQIQMVYDPEKEKYITRYTTLSINCESCHGPGKRHIELANSGELNSLREMGMAALWPVSKDESLKTCLRCHSSKFPIYNFGAYLPGKDLDNYYSQNLTTWYLKELHADGRVKSFCYQKNHLYSDCYLSGSMTCVDCHDPHSQKYRDIWGKELVGRFDDVQCLDCHESKRKAILKHTHHKKGSKGSLCISCHMPFLQHPALGNEVRFARSDHTIPIPRPEFDNKLKIENACYKCHKDIKISELQKITDEWYGTLKPHRPIITALSEEKYSSRSKAAAKLLDDSFFHPMAQVVALTRFLFKFTTPDMLFLEPEIIEKLKKLCYSPSLDVQALALAGLHITRGNEDEVHSFLWKREKTMDRTSQVKYRWILALKNMALTNLAMRKYDIAKAILRKAMEIEPTNPFLYFFLGSAFADTGDRKNAMSNFRKAIEIEPNGAKFRDDFAKFLFFIGKRKEAIPHLKKLLRLHPDNMKLRQFLFSYENSLR
ncbi:multiheme c-type cytochrome [Candidatus Riflebacteria bacterium]